MMELGFKIITTLITLFFVYLFLSWMWIHQIDVKETLLGPLKKKVNRPIDWIATRDLKAIYQSDKIVGNITGDVIEKNGKIVFKEICNTSDFDHSMPFEYKRETFKVISIDSIIGIYSSATNKGIEVKNNVLKDILCERVE